jgi:hypothetical protein
MADVDPFATATELLAVLRARRVSARELGKQVASVVRPTRQPLVQPTCP